MYNFNKHSLFFYHTYAIFGNDLFCRKFNEEQFCIDVFFTENESFLRKMRNKLSTSKNCAYYEPPGGSTRVGGEGFLLHVEGTILKTFQQ